MRGSIQRRGKRSWRLKWDLGNDPDSDRRVTKYKTVRGTKREAEAELASILGAIQGGRYVDPTKLSVGEVLVKWRDEVATASVSAKTFERYNDHIDRLISGLGRIPLAKLTPLAIQSLYSELRTSGHKLRAGGLSEQTILHIHRLLTAALGQAVKWRLIPTNPATDVSPPKVARVEMRTLGEDEAGRLLAFAGTTRLYVPIIVLLTTGMRRGELLALKWADVDFGTGRISIVRSLEETRGGLALKAPKTDRSRRTIPLPATTIDHLRRHRANQLEQRLKLGEGWKDADLVFPNEAGGLWRPHNATRAFAKIAARAEIEGITIHSMRHSHVTELLRAGVHAKVVSERAGHSTVAFTLQRYAHALPDMQENAADQAEVLVGRILTR